MEKYNSSEYFKPCLQLYAGTPADVTLVRVCVREGIGSEFQICEGTGFPPIRTLQIYEGIGFKEFYVRTTFK